MQAAATRIRKLFTPGAPGAITAQVQAADTPTRPPLGFPPLPLAAIAEPLLPLSEARDENGMAHLSFKQSPLGATAKTIRATIASYLDHESGLALAGTSKKNHEEQLGALHEHYGTALPVVRDYLKCAIDIDDARIRIRAREAEINLAARQNEAGNRNLPVLKIYQREDKDRLESLEDQKDRLERVVDGVLKCQIDHGMHHQTVLLRVNIDAALRQKSPAELVGMYRTIFREAIATAPLLHNAQRLTDDLNYLAEAGLDSLLQDSLHQLVSTLDDNLRAEACVAVVHWDDVQPVATAHQSHGPIDHDAPD